MYKPLLIISSITLVIEIGRISIVKECSLIVNLLVFIMFFLFNSSKIPMARDFSKLSSKSKVTGTKSLDSSLACIFFDKQ